MTKKRVVITGMGAVTPYGVGVEHFWNGIKSGVSCIKNTENIRLDGQAVKISGEIKADVFDVKDYIEPKEARRLDKFIQYAVVASDEAVKDAGLENLEEQGIDPYRVGTMIGTAAGGFATFEEQHNVMIARGPLKCSPFTVPMIIVNMATGKVSIRHGFKGVNKCVSTACASGTHSIGDAFRAILYGDADIMLTGASEAAVTYLSMGAFAVARTLSRHNDEPEKASRPYDKDRDGFVMSEGAGVLVLEEYEHAKKRGAKIYAEIVGYGQTADAYDIVAPDPEAKGALKAMEFALKDANMQPSDIQYINAHGTSTGLGDIAESNAIAKLFGDLTTNKDLLVSSTKSMMGHALGAAGALESIICIKAMNESCVPPTINLDNQDEHVANLNYVPHKPVNVEVNAALNNSFGFGGHNATLIFKKCND